LYNLQVHTEWFFSKKKLLVQLRTNSFCLQSNLLFVKHIATCHWQASAWWAIGQ
jgi:hypothetical protein